MQPDLLKQIAESTSAIRNDIDKISIKLDSYSERLVRVESTQGFIKSGLSILITAITGVVSYLVYKYIDLSLPK